MKKEDQQELIKSFQETSKSLIKSKNIENMEVYLDSLTALSQGFGPGTDPEFSTTILTLMANLDSAIKDLKTQSQLPDNSDTESTSSLPTDDEEPQERNTTLSGGTFGPIPITNINTPPPRGTNLLNQGSPEEIKAEVDTIGGIKRKSPNIKTLRLRCKKRSKKSKTSSNNRLPGDNSHA